VELAPVPVYVKSVVKTCTRVTIPQVESACLAAEIPSWQIPELVVDKEKRSSDFKLDDRDLSLILPDAGADLIASIVAELPLLRRVRPSWHLGYSMSADGVSLRTLYRHVENCGACIVIVEDSNSCIFGAFLGGGLHMQRGPYEDYESFLFRYPRSAGPWRAEIFQRSVSEQSHESSSEPTVVADVQTESQEVCDGASCAASKLIQKGREQALSVRQPAAIFCDTDGIIIGIDGPALHVGSDLLHGGSWPSKAYGSSCLAGTGPEFVISKLEVWHWEEE